MTTYFPNTTGFKPKVLAKAALYGAFVATLCVLIPAVVFAETVTIGKQSNGVKVLSSRSSSCVMEVSIGKFRQNSVMVNNEKYFSVSLPGETLLKKKGAPELPTLARSISIPGESGVSAKVIESKYVEYNMPIAPSKGILTRDIDPGKVPFSFGEVYQKNQFYPQRIVTLGEPYLLREVRGVSVNIAPMAYNPVTRILRVYTKLTIEVLFEGRDDRNTLERSDGTYNPFFAPVYQEHFLNLEIYQDLLHLLKADDIVMLVIADDDFVDEMHPFVDHKNDIGLTTVMVRMSDVGTSAGDVQTYIQNYYDTHSSLTYVLLVGDNAQIPTPMYMGGGSDPSYSLVAGSDDYPDIFIGRFSAETGAQVETMVQRSIAYETSWKGAWFHNGMGIASNQGTGDDGEYDWEHERNIRGVLTGWHYTTIGEFYDGSHGGADAAGNPTAASIAAAVNNGVSVINYTGHGSTTSWSTSGFSNTDVNNLINDDELPFIFSVACVNGNFTGTTSFSEAWLRAQNSTTGNPTGAIGFYGSTINQYWSPPMEAQDEFNNMLANEDHASLGALCYNASAAMMDAYGASGTDMFLTWTLFGDPSITVGLACFSDLPDPVLKLKGTTTYTIGTQQFTRYNLEVTNWSSFPNQLFDSAPYLPACGLNANASRTWVDIYNGVTNRRIYGFCGLNSNDDLTRLWFAVPRGTPAPRSVYIVIDDRHCGFEFISNTVSTLILKPIPFP